MENFSFCLICSLVVFIWLTKTHATDLNATRSPDDDETDELEHKIQQYITAQLRGANMTTNMGAIFRFPWGLDGTSTKPSSTQSSTAETSTEIWTVTTLSSTTTTTLSTTPTTTSTTTTTTPSTTLSTTPTTSTTTTTTPFTTLSTTPTTTTATLSTTSTTTTTTTNTPSTTLSTTLATTSTTTTTTPSTTSSTTPTSTSTTPTTTTTSTTMSYTPTSTTTPPTTPTTTATLSTTPTTLSTTTLSTTPITTPTTTTTTSSTTLSTASPTPTTTTTTSSTTLSTASPTPTTTTTTSSTTLSTASPTPTTTTTSSTTTTTTVPIATISSANVSVSDEESCSRKSNGSVWLNDVQLNATVDSWQSANVTFKSYVFYGIKYGNAKRFQAPVMNTDHSYYYSPSRPLTGYQCPQMGGSQPMSEDCLFLNVFVPSSTKFIGDGNCSSTPVLLFVHGGAYRSGGKDLYPSMNLSNAIDAIVVVPNYRLGVFGFFSTQDKVATGNWGLHDLKLALKWTSENIRNFGGNSSRITVIGHSTGAALVSFLMLDPENRDILHGAVAMSGSSLAPWAMGRNVKSSAIHLSRMLKCPENSSDAMVSCLKTKNAVDLLEYTSMKNNSIPIFTYGPIIDGLLIPDEPERLMSRDSWNFPGSFTNGFMAQDASVLLAPDQIWHDLTASKSLEPVVEWFQQLTFPDTIHTIFDCKSPPTYMMKQIFSFYEMSKSRSWGETRRKLIEIATDLLFVVPAVKEAEFYAKYQLSKKGNILYNISYSEKPVFRSFPATSSSSIGAPHALDLAYLFGAPVANMLLIDLSKTFDTMTSNERDLIKSIVTDNSLLNVTTQFTTGNSTYLSLESPIGWVTRQENFSKLINFWDTIHNYAC